MTAGDAVTLHTDRDWIEGFLRQAAEAVSTGRKSVQDAPDQPGAVRVELGTGETPDWSVLYVYEAEDGCCLEQPYEWDLAGRRCPLDTGDGGRAARGHRDGGVSKRR